MSDKKYQYLIDQGELWHRSFIVEADSEQEAKQRYLNYCSDGQEEIHGITYIYDPEYVDDVEGDVTITKVFRTGDNA